MLPDALCRPSTIYVLSIEVLLRHLCNLIDGLFGHFDMVQLFVHPYGCGHAAPINFLKKTCLFLGSCSSQIVSRKQHVSIKER